MVGPGGGFFSRNAMWNRVVHEFSEFGREGMFKSVRLRNDDGKKSAVELNVRSVGHRFSH